MPTLTYIDSNTSYGGVLNSRALIGRRLSHGVVLSDTSVSRLHAWIDPVASEEAEQWVVTDAGSKTGTFVNDQPINRQALEDGDTIRVGTVSLTYHADDHLPDDVTRVELSSPEGVVRTSGILFECSCGAPLWVGNELAGKRGMCRHCRQPVTVPQLVEPETAAVPQATEIATPPGRSTKCAICHSEISAGESKTTCPDCAMTYHTDCWDENLGCSTYGCPQVNILAPVVETPPVATADPESTSPGNTPWEFILLAASVVGSLVGALLFGGLAAVVAILSVVILIRGKARRPALLVLAIVISLAGIAAGLGVSDFWYFNAKHLPAGWVRH